jgi:hypothetical protein
MSENESGGCLKWFIAGMIVFLVSVLVLIFGGYYVIFHTAWPVEKIVNAMTADSDVEIEGIEGSISSGFSVEKIRFPDAKGNINEIDDIAFKYGSEEDVFVINDIHVARAHFFVDDLLKESDEDGAGSSGTTTTGNNGMGPQNSEPLNIIVKKVDIGDITIEDRNTGAKVEIDKIYLDGFEILNDDVKLGTLTIKSDYCDISVKPLDSSLEMATEHVIQGIIKTGINEYVVKDIDISGKCIVENKESYSVDLKMFDGKCLFNMKQPGKVVILNINDFSPNEYISSIFCIKNINFQYKGKDGKGKADVANFKIGSKLFECDKTQFEDDEKKDLVATCKDGKIEYTCILLDKGKGVPKVKLSSVPKMSQNDILGMLLFDSKYGKLTADQKKTVDEELKKGE